MQMVNEAIAWVKSASGSHGVVQIVPALKEQGKVLCYQLYTAYEPNPDYLGRILFDTEGFWIYDGNVFSISEQEQLAKFIINYAESI